MKLTTALWRQHIGYMTKRHWWIQGKRIIRDTAAEKLLVTRGINVLDATEVTKKPKVVMDGFTKFPEPLVPRPPALNREHPDWNERPCLMYGANNLLLEGTDQAQLLIKAELIADALPERLNVLKEQQSPEIHKLIQRMIHSTHIFDAHQEKLPKKRDPLKPEWNFPRIYGIPDARKMHNLTQKLLQICEIKSDPMIARQRKIIHGGQVRTFIEKGDDLLYFESAIDTMITANKLLTPMSTEKNFSTPLPDLGPLDPTISMQPQHIYSLQDHYPVATESQWMNVHTIFLNFNRENVKHLTELPVTESQIRARSMLQSFNTAACCAKLKFGEETMDLPEPITVQCIQSDGQWFYFSVLQLNTLNITGTEGTKNIWWHSPKYELFEQAEYVGGIPTLSKYNPEIFNKILAFYRNV